MQCRWRLAVMCVRGPLRGALSRSWLWRKLSLAALLCGLCVVFYYHHITSGNNRGKITDSGRGSFLVAVSSLQSFTEISRQYPERRQQHTSSTPSKGDVGSNPNFLKTPLSASETATAPLLTEKSQMSTESVRSLRTGGTTLKTATDSREVKSKVANSREKSGHVAESARLPRVLLLYGHDGFKPSLEIKTFLESHRIPFHHSSLDKSRYFISNSSSTSDRELSLVVVVSYLHSSSVEPYLDYCRARLLPLIWAALPESHSDNPKPHVSNLRSSAIRSEAIVHVTLSPSFPFYYGRPGAMGEHVAPPHTNWTTFSPERSGDSHLTNNPLPLPNSSLDTAYHQNVRERGRDTLTGSEEGTRYRTLVEVGLKTGAGETGSVGYSKAAVVVEDLGRVDGVRKIVMGTPLRLWLTHLMLLDAVHLLCQGLVREGRERLVMVDIDDVFLAPEGRRMTQSDVQALLQTQAELRQLVPGFTFNAGFVGGYYDNGLETERLGNQELVRNADQLWWFGHTYKHRQPHMMNSGDLRTSMELNQQFAKEHGIPASIHHYSVAPHHSGVYPVYPPLYQTWREVWNVSVTTTEEYPNLRPDHRRRGFRHRGISTSSDSAREKKRKKKKKKKKKSSADKEEVVEGEAVMAHAPLKLKITFGKSSEHFDS